MRTTHSSTITGGLHDTDPLDRQPPDRDPPGQGPPSLYRDPAPRTETPPVNRQTKACENITLPQTSFAGGNKLTPQHKTMSWITQTSVPIRVKFTVSGVATRVLKSVRETFVHHPGNFRAVSGMALQAIVQVGKRSTTKNISKCYCQSHPKKF